ncbi:MAG: phosphoglycerate kinase, partial [bacterium]
MNKITINDLNLEGKCVLTRVDFNVPLSPDGRVSDDTRMRASLPSINMILEKGASLVLMSHLGRPKGSVVPEMSLRPVAEHLSELLGRDVYFASDCASEEAYQKRSRLLAGDVMLLENLRFHKGETDNDAGFAERLAKLGDVYVNDAFGTAHRAHASTEGVTKFFDLSAAGLLMEKEINYLSNAIENPTRPLMGILGGAKVSGKMDVIQNLLPKVDVLLIGGGMAFTFLKAQGHEI